MASDRISVVWQCHSAGLLPQCGHRLRQTGALVSARPQAGRPGGGRELAAAGLGWTSWDMIQNVRCADQANSGITDATRTERGFHAARIGEIAGQRPFRWVTMGSL